MGHLSSFLRLSSRRSYRYATSKHHPGICQEYAPPTAAAGCGARGLQRGGGVLGRGGASAHACWGRGAWGLGWGAAAALSARLLSARALAALAAALFAYVELRLGPAQAQRLGGQSQAA